MIQIDTHVAVWLFVADFKRFPPRVRGLLEENDLSISPMAVLELELLREIGRTPVESTMVIASLRASTGLTIADAPISAVVAAARPLSWTRDPFDRLIVGSAAAAGQRLVTCDRTIRKHFVDATW
jgi:PIN domain nuclease of toxin-antitoxin system